MKYCIPILLGMLATACVSDVPRNSNPDLVSKEKNGWLAFNQVCRSYMIDHLADWDWLTDSANSHTNLGENTPVNYKGGDFAAPGTSHRFWEHNAETEKFTLFTPISNPLKCYVRIDKTQHDVFALAEQDPDLKELARCRGKEEVRFYFPKQDGHTGLIFWGRGDSFLLTALKNQEEDLSTLSSPQDYLLDSNGYCKG